MEPMGYLSPGVAVYPGATDGDLLVVEKQTIPDEFVPQLQERNAKLRSERKGDVMRVGTIPAIFIYKWRREGLDIFTAPLKEIIRKIYDEGVEDFLVRR